jgi:copper chaperone CopZ
MVFQIMKEMKIKTDGIVCAGCADDMEKILRETEGILYASVDYPNEVICIKYDPDFIDRKKVYLAVRRLCKISKIISES